MPQLIVLTLTIKLYSSSQNCTHHHKTVNKNIKRCEAKKNFCRVFLNWKTYVECAVVLVPLLKPGWVNRVTFCIGHRGQTHFKNYAVGLDHVQSKLISWTIWKCINVSYQVLMQSSFFCEPRPLIRRLPAALHTATPIYQ